MNTDLTPLASLLDNDSLLTDADSLTQYGKDWTSQYQPAPLAICLPKSTEQVKAIIDWANQHKIAVVPSGGRTGLSGGAVASNGEIVIALDKMNQILEFEAAANRVHCQAGVITQQLQQFAEDQDLIYPVDFASSGSSQIGGNIATNAGGIKVIKYGLTRDWVLGLTVVTGAGEILKLNNGLVKNATGYDLRHLFIGSEGTLGVITEATMALAKPPTDLTVLLLGIPELSSLMPLLKQFQSAIDLTAFEFFSDKALDKVMQVHKLPCPVSERTSYYCLLEFDAQSEALLEKALEVFEQSLEQEIVLDGVMSQSEQQAQELWKYREFISESISHQKPYKNDIAVTPEKITEFLTSVDEIVQKEYPDFEVIWFGHIGDGNLHLNILPPENLPHKDFVQQCEQVNPQIFTVLEQLNGSISAEHGVGLLKQKYLSYSRSASEIAMMRGIKAVFDPNNIINPGKIFES